MQFRILKIIASTLNCIDNWKLMQLIHQLCSKGKIWRTQNKLLHVGRTGADHFQGQTNVDHTALIQLKDATKMWVSVSKFSQSRKGHTLNRGVLPSRSCYLLLYQELWTQKEPQIVHQLCQMAYYPTEYQGWQDTKAHIPQEWEIQTLSTCETIWWSG